MIKPNLAEWLKAHNNSVVGYPSGCEADPDHPYVEHDCPSWGLVYARVQILGGLHFRLSPDLIHMLAKPEWHEDKSYNPPGVYWSYSYAPPNVHPPKVYRTCPSIAQTLGVHFHCDPTLLSGAVERDEVISRDS